MVSLWDIAICPFFTVLSRGHSWPHSAPLGVDFLPSRERARKRVLWVMAISFSVASGPLLCRPTKPLRSCSRSVKSDISPPIWLMRQGRWKRQRLCLVLVFITSCCRACVYVDLRSFSFACTPLLRQTWVIWPRLKLILLYKLLIWGRM